MFGCGGLTIANYGSGTLEHRLVGANKQGVFRSFHNTSSSGMSIDGMSYAVDDTDRHTRLRIHSGYQTIQGPGEANWGYTCPILFDWNSDGNLDIIFNSSFGNLQVLLQVDGAADPAVFTEPLPLYCDSLDLHLCWRAQPGVTTWGGQTDPCIIANDENNQFRRYYRLDNQNVIRGDVLTTGEAIQAHDSRYGGQWGRSKIVPVDWDQDGKIDLLVGTGRAQSIPGEGGMPDNLTGDDRQSSVLFLRNAGSNAAPEFEYPVRVRYNDTPIRLGVHSCSPALVDFGEGSSALVVGEEDGNLIYYPRDNLSNPAD